MVQLNPSLEDKLDLLSVDPSLPSPLLQQQFTSLTEHLLRLPPPAWAQPKIVVLDALDECNDGNELIATLASEIPKLASHLRFFITCRSASDLLLTFGSTAAGNDLSLMNNDFSVQRDILNFIHLRLTALSIDGSPSPFDAHDVNELAGQAGGHFVWASTACWLISKSPHPKTELADLLTIPTGEILPLYRRVLRQSAPEDSEFKTKVSQVLSVVAIVGEPLAPTTIDALLEFASGDTDKVVRRVGSIVNYTVGDGVKFVHQSFRDFIMSPACEEDFRVDTKLCHRNLALTCFNVMACHLKHDICGIGDSSQLNGEVPNLALAISSLPPGLVYACSHCAYHLAACGEEGIRDPELADRILMFFHRHLLHWFEMLSLMKSLVTGSEFFRTLNSIVEV